jgi:hypothetical protein
MDITDNMLAAAAAAPVVLPAPAPAPEPQHLPMLHLAVPHHPLAAERVQQVRGGGAELAQRRSSLLLRLPCV